MPSYAQDTGAYGRPLENDSFAFLYNKYLNTKGDPEEKIGELISLAQNDPDEFSGLRKVQIALLLANQVKPSNLTFELNVYTGIHISRISKGYALEFFENATDIANRIEGISAWQKFNMYTNRAGVHHYLMEGDSAKYFYYQAINQARMHDHISESSSYNNLGIFYSETGENDSARIYYQKALVTLNKMEDDYNLYSAILDNVAQLNVQEENYHEALKAFWFNDSIYLARAQPWHYVNNKIRLLSTLQKVNDPGIHSQIQQLQSFIEQQGSKIDDKTILDFYLFANDYYFTKNDRLNGSFYRLRYRKLNDLLEQREIDEINKLTHSLMGMQALSFKSDIEAQQLRAEKNKLELKEARRTMFTSIVFGLLIILILVVYIRKRKLENEAAKKLAETELRNKEMEARLLQQDLELKKHDLTNVVLHNTQVYDSNRKIIERLEDIGQQRTNLDQHVRSLLIELQSQNQISERSIGLQSNIDSVNAEFYEKLKTKFPELTKSEAELCGYIRINLSTKDISILKNVAATSVKMGKNRLRKKLGLSPEEDLYQFIREI